MPYDEKLAEQIDKALIDKSSITTKKMFGGICYLHKGNMVCGVTKDDFMVRVGPDNYEKALKRNHARTMDFTGKPLKGMVYVSPEGIKTTTTLKSWLEMALKFTSTLPKK